MIDRFTRTWLHVVTEYPRLVLLIVAGLLVLSGLGLPRFKLDASSDSLTLENDKDLDYFRQTIKSYGSGDFLIITFRPEQELFSEPSLLLLQNLQQELEQIDGVVGSNSILNVPLLFSPKQSLREIAQEPRRLLDEGVDWQLAKKEFLTSPIYRKLILGQDGQTTALQLNLAVDERFIELVSRRDELRELAKQSGFTSDQRRELEQVSQTFLNYRTNADRRNHQRVEEVREVVRRYQDEAQIFVGGVTMITADMISFIRKDLIVFGAAVIAFMTCVLAVIFRSVRFVAIPMATCLSAVFFMLGLISWLDWRLTVISSNFVALLLIISLAIIIHLVVRYREYLSSNPDWSQKQLVVATIKFMALPCWYTALTTIVAFASLVVSDIRPVIDFGWMMTIGLVFALVLAFILLPASLMLLPKQGSRQSKASSKSSKPLTLYCSAAVENHGTIVLIASAHIAVLSAWGITQLKVENKFIDYFRADTEIHQGLAVIDQQLGGTTSLDIILNADIMSSGEREGEVFAEDFDEGFDDDEFIDDEFVAADDSDFESDEFASEDFDDGFETALSMDEENKQKSVWMSVVGLQKIEAIHDYLDNLPEVGKVQSLGMLYKVGKEINGSLNNFELALLEKSLPQSVSGVLYDPFVDSATDATRISMRIVDTYPGLERKKLVEKIETDLHSVHGLEDTQFRTTGLLVLYNNMLQSLFSSQIVTLGAVFLGIMTMFMILFRSLSVAFVAIVPNILAALSIVGGMGLAGIPLDMMTITIAAITVGIGVDDTIHYIHRFKKELQIDNNYVAAMHRAHGSIGRAMYYTSVIIIFGFSIMVLSEFIPTIYFGLLTGLAMLAALAGALLLLPKLILIVKPFKTT